MDPFKLLAYQEKIDKSKQKMEAKDLYSFSLNARMSISARPGYVLCSIDFKNQELEVYS